MVLVVEEVVGLTVVLVAMVEYGATHLSGQKLGHRAVVVQAERMVVLAPLEHPENLDAATVEVAAAGVHRAELEESLAAEAAEQEALSVEILVAGAEARCVYGPGSSERCWIERPGCAEA